MAIETQSVLARAAESWYEAAEEASYPTNEHHRLRRALRELLSADALTGVGFLGDIPIVLAIDGSRLLCIALETSEGGPALIKTSSISLTAHPRLDLADKPEVIAGSHFLVRTWTFDGSLEITTRRSRHEDFVPDRGGEAVMKEAARRLDWPMPGTD